jgi:hypothetical protein
MFKTLLVLHALGLAAMLRAEGISEVSSTRVTSEAPAFGPNGKVRLQTSEALVDLHLADGTPSKGDLLVLFDPETQRFLWREGTHSPDMPFELQLRNGIASSPWHALVSSPGRLLWMQANGLSLDIQYSSEKAKDLDDAFTKALSELNSGWVRYYQKAEYPNRKTVEFAGLELRRFIENDDAPNGLMLRIENVQFTDKGYAVTLLGAWKAQVTVGEDLTVKEPFHQLE